MLREFVGIAVTVGYFYDALRRLLVFLSLLFKYCRCCVLLLLLLPSLW